MTSLLQDLDVASLALQLGLATHDQVYTALHELGRTGGSRGLLAILVEMGFLDAEERDRVEAGLSSARDALDRSAGDTSDPASTSDEDTLAQERGDGEVPPPLPSGVGRDPAPSGPSSPRRTGAGRALPGAGSSVVRALQAERGIAGQVRLPGQGAYSERSFGPDGFAGTAYGPDSKYLFGREIGKGGNGVVTLAYEVDIGRRVALKTLRSGREATNREVERFVEEAQITGQLEHPNIVPVHELGRLPDGELHFTMKLVEGRTLDTALRGLRKGIASFRRQYGRARLLHIVQQVCQGVGYAHSKGVVHRDLKPANIMLGEYGEVVIMDWGLAKVRGSPDPQGDDGGRRVHTLRSRTGAADTLQGTIKGTPAYMSPEQALGQVDRIDERSDVYSLGAILYECLTLKRPHEGRDPMAVVRAVAHEPVVPPRRRAPDGAIPEELEAIVMRCLAREPDRRYPTAMALHQEIENHLEGTRRRRQAAQKVHEANRLAEVHERLRREVAALHRAFRERSRQLTPWDPVELKRPVWEMQRELTRKEVEAADTLGEAITRYGQALAYDPENRNARLGLAALYWSRFLDAEARRDPRDTHYFRKLIEQHDDGSYAERLKGGGTLEVVSSPPGAHATVWRYEERDLVETPVDHRALGAAPVAPVRLPLGSHLLVLACPGYLETRVPLRLERGEERRVEVEMPRDGVVPDDLVYVPAGTCVLGGDPQAFDALERETRDVPGFAIGRFPVTMAEYLEFVQALAAQDPLLAQFRAPRSRTGTESYFARGADGRYAIPGVDRRGDPFDPRLPVFGVSWTDACAYAEWRSARDGRRYRLPNDAEWEKAARGADGRYHPWGDLFDPSFCKTEEARRRRPTPEPVGAFPQDASVYGVRDLAGGVREWCGDWFDAYRKLRLVRGGAWDLPRAWSRVCNRYGEAEEQVADDLGFRLVLELGT